MSLDLTAFDDLLRKVPEPGRTALRTSITDAVVEGWVPVRGDVELMVARQLGHMSPEEYVALIAGRPMTTPQPNS